MRKQRSDASNGKRCNNCGFTKSLEDFNRSTRSKDGRQYTCRSCSNRSDKERLRIPEKAEANRAKAIAYYQANQEKIKEYQAKRQLKLKLQAVNYLGGKCQGCEEDHPAALQFHHRDPATKSFSVSTKTMASTKQFNWTRIKQELDKCDLLCSNCHAKHHTAWTDEMLREAREENHVLLFQTIDRDKKCSK